MASSPPTQPPPSESQPRQQTQTLPTDKYNNVNPMIHNVALITTPLALLGLALPPRRLELRAVLLGGVALWGTNQLTHDYSGKSFGQRLSATLASASGLSLSEKAKETQARIRMEKEHRAKLQALRDEMVRSGAVQAKGKGLEGWTDDEKKALLEAYEQQRSEAYEKQRREAEAGKKEKGVLQKIWMGDAPPDWKEQLERREREALQEGGGGYWGLITSQINEVLNGGKTDGGDAPKEEKGDNTNNR